MHKFKRNPISLEDNLKSVGKGLHNDQRIFFTAEEDNLKAAFKQYDEYASKNPVDLEALHPLWEILPTDADTERQQKEEKQNRSFKLYGSNRPFVNDHWEALKAENGGKVLMCPICGLTECSEMDHYIPRSIFQEFSSHVNNLIPLCHTCNLDKHNDWTDRHGNRYFFNAFYDKLPGTIIACTISINLGFPKINVKISSALDKNDYSDAIVLRTFKKLDLLKKFQICAKGILRNEIIRMRNDYKVQKATYNNDRQAFWNSRVASFRSYISSPGGFNFLEKKIFEAIVYSAEMKDWVVNSMEFVK